MSNEPLLSLTGLKKSFSSGDRCQQVIRGAALDLQEGEVLVLLGTSGSGKSTLLNLIAGLEYPDAGDVRIIGQSLTAMSEQQRTLFRRRHIGIVFQFFNLIQTLSVRENLLLPVQLNGLTTTDSETDELLDQLGLSRYADRWPEQLSGGEQQRVAIGRALIHRPTLLLADEPTGSLDNDTAERVTGLLFEQVRRRRQSLLLVTHNEALAEQADRVLQLHQGVLWPAGSREGC